MASRQQDNGAAKQIQISKLHTAKAIEDRRPADDEFGTAMQNLQQEIDNGIELAKLWQIKERSDPIFKEIELLMDQAKLNLKHHHTDETMEQALVPSNWCIKSRDSSVVDGMPTSFFV